MHACIGEGNGNPLQYSCLENPRDEGAWLAAIYGVAQSWTRLKRLSSSSSKENLLSVQFSSVTQLCPTLCDPMNHSTPGLPVHHHLPLSSLKLTSIKSVMPSIHLILCCPLLLLPPIPPSIRVFANESTLRMRWPKYCSFSFNVSPSNEHPGLISFRMDWWDLLAVQEIGKASCRERV